MEEVGRQQKGDPLKLSQISDMYSLFSPPNVSRTLRARAMHRRFSDLGLDTWKISLLEADDLFAKPGCTRWESDATLHEVAICQDGSKHFPGNVHLPRWSTVAHHILSRAI